MKNCWVSMVGICMIASVIFAIAAFARGDAITGGVMLICASIYYSAIAVIETIKEKQ